MPASKVSVPRKLIKDASGLAAPKVAQESPAERGWFPEYSLCRR